MDINSEERRRLERHAMDLTNSCRKLEDLAKMLDAVDDNSILAVRLYKEEHDSTSGYYLSAFTGPMQKAVRAEIVIKMHALELDIADLRKRLA